MHRLRDSQSWAVHSQVLSRLSGREKRETEAYQKLQTQPAGGNLSGVKAKNA